MRRKKTFHFGTKSYDYVLVLTNRKTISLVVEPNLKIFLKAPKEISEEKINNFLMRKWKWLKNNLEYFSKFQKKRKLKEYVSGESFMYLGKQYMLDIILGDSDSVTLQKNKIMLQTSNRITNFRYTRKVLNSWYEKQTNEVFNLRYKEVLLKFDYEFIPELVIRKMNKRWGSYLLNKKVILNPELIKYSIDCIDYVITHELCHMEVPNHSKRFYELLNKKYPRWNIVKDKLDNYQL